MLVRTVYNRMMLVELDSYCQLMIGVKSDIVIVTLIVTYS